MIFFYNVYGPGQILNSPMSAVIGIFEHQYRNNKNLSIVKPGTQRRDFTHVEDIVDGLIKCHSMINKYTWPPANSFNQFELGIGKNYSINDIADAFGDYPREYIDEWRGEMRDTLCTDTKAKDLLGWKPTRDIIEYVKETNG